jgi:hypothetical protein
MGFCVTKTLLEEKREIHLCLKHIAECLLEKKEKNNFSHF